MLSSRKGDRSGHLPSAGVKPGYAGLESDNSVLELISKSRKEKWSSTGYTLLDMFISFVP